MTSYLDFFLYETLETQDRWLLVFLYSYQIADFFGYSAIAIGLAHLFGYPSERDYTFIDAEQAWAEVVGMFVRQVAICLKKSRWCVVVGPLKDQLCIDGNVGALLRVVRSAFALRTVRRCRANANRPMYWAQDREQSRSRGGGGHGSTPASRRSENGSEGRYPRLHQLIAVSHSVRFNVACNLWRSRLEVTTNMRGTMVLGYDLFEYLGIRVFS